MAGSNTEKQPVQYGPRHKGFWWVMGLCGAAILVIYAADPKVREGAAKKPERSYTVGEDEFLNSPARKEGLYEAIAACKGASIKVSRFGEPRFSLFGFHSAIDGWHARHGRIALVDEGAQLQNGFGVWSNGTLLCDYDPDARKVVDLKWVTR